MLKQRQDLQARFNTVDTEWRTNREKLALLMSFYHHSKPEVIQAWDGAQRSVSAYVDCTRAQYLRYQRDHVTLEEGNAKAACAAGKEEMRKKLDTLTEQIEAARGEASEGWESPDKLMRKLEAAQGK